MSRFNSEASTTPVISDQRFDDMWKAFLAELPDKYRKKYEAACPHPPKKTIKWLGHESLTEKDLLHESTIATPLPGWHKDAKKLLYGLSGVTLRDYNLKLARNVIAFTMDGKAAFLRWQAEALEELKREDKATRAEEHKKSWEDKWRQHKGPLNTMYRSRKQGERIKIPRCFVALQD